MALLSPRVILSFTSITALAKSAWKLLALDDHVMYPSPACPYSAMASIDLASLQMATPPRPPISLCFLPLLKPSPQHLLPSTCYVFFSSDAPIPSLEQKLSQCRPFEYCIHGLTLSA